MPRQAPVIEEGEEVSERLEVVSRGLRCQWGTDFQKGCKMLRSVKRTDAQVREDAEEQAVSDHKVRGLVWYGLFWAVKI